jgi:hypothetical protein
VRPVSVQDVLPLVAQVFAPGVMVTEYLVIGLPLVTGAVQLTVISPTPGVPITRVGARGAPTTTGAEADAGLWPLAFRAVTVTEYDPPSVRPKTVQVLAPVVEHDLPPGSALAV